MKFLYKVSLSLLTIFLIAFPKGGFKVGGIPITWGYILILVYAIICFFSIKKLSYFKKERQQVLLLCLPFILYASIILLLSNISNLSVLFSFILGLFLFPCLFLYIFNKDIEDCAFNTNFLPVFKKCIRFIVIFGIVVFIYKLKTGNDFEIPFLTVNYSDIGTLDSKYNLRGDISKLISTYNNGNIYGICMLMLLPLYLNIERALIFKILFFISIILTLSRTVWMGLIIYLLLYVSGKIKDIKGWMILTVTVVIVSIGGSLFLSFIGKDVNFLFDRQLGGRVDQLTILNNLSIFGDFDFDVITEIVYASILKHFGLLGLFFFVCYLSAPLIIFYGMKKSKRNSRFLYNLHWGLIVYLILCFSDGAILLIPVMAFFWFLSSYILKLQVDL